MTDEELSARATSWPSVFALLTSPPNMVAAGSGDSTALPILAAETLAYRVHCAAPTGGKTVTVTSSYMLVTQESL